MNATQNVMSDLERKRADYPAWGYTIVGAILLFVAIFGIITNIIALRIFATNKHLRSPTIILIMGLSVCDLCMAVLGIPLSCLAAFAGKWNSGENGCKFSAFICYVFSLSSVYILATLSVDRYIVIVKPKWSNETKRTKRSAMLALVACLAGGLVFGLFPLFGWNGYGLELSGVSCGLQYHDTSWTSKSFIVVVAVFCFLIPFGIMACCYYKIFSHIRSLRQNMLVSGRYASCRFKMECKVLKTCIAMVVSFWACWMPYAFISFWQAFGNVDDMPVTLTLLPALAAKSQLVLDPLIYVGTNSLFRRALLQSFSCSSGEVGEPIEQVEIRATQTTNCRVVAAYHENDTGL